MTVFLLIVGMCQSRIEADFCFELETNGQVAAFLEFEEGEISSFEISAGDSLRFQELTIGVRDARMESKRTITRFLVQLLQAVTILSYVSVFQRTTDVQVWEEDSCTDIIVHYLHQKDGKK